MVIKIKNEMVVPFSNGTDAMYWQERNCFQCSLYENISTSENEASCVPAYHVDLGFIEGEIPLVSAEKIGILNKSGRSVGLSDCKMKKAEERIRGNNDRNKK